MKKSIFIYMPILFSLIYTLTMCHQVMNNSDSSKELFRQMIDKDHSNYIEIDTSNGSTRGIFYGVEIYPGEKPLFFRSKMDTLEWDSTKIKFQLDNFDVSYQPFHENETPSLLDPREKIFNFSFPRYYWGTRSSDSLKLIRALAIYDSRGDDAIFVKVGNPEERK